MRTIGPAIAILLACGSLAFAQILPPGVNPNNPNDMSHRSNPNDMTLPGAANPQDMVRRPVAPQVVSPNPNLVITSRPPVSSSLSHTHIDRPIKNKEMARRKRRVPSEARYQ